MSVYHGFLYAFLAACSNTVIDALRKVASQRLPTDRLVCMGFVLDAVLSVSFVAGQGGFRHTRVYTNQIFMYAVLGASIVRLLSNIMYQTALLLSPISLAVPYLAFNAAFLIVIAFFVVGEVPSGLGVAGVLVVAMGGFLLSATKGSSDKDQGPQHQLRGVSTTTAEAPRGLGSFWSSSQQLPKGHTTGSVGSGQQPGVGSDGKGIKLAELERPKSGDAALGRRMWWTAWVPVKEQGSALMVGVAVLWSFTSSFDKIGLLHSHSNAVYLAINRIAMSVPCLVYLLLKTPDALGQYWRHGGLLLGISVAELTAIMCYLKSLEYLLLAYAVAVKRSGLLLSVLVGAVAFQEPIWKRLPPVMVMMGGMMMIILAPQQSGSQGVH